MSDWPSFDEPTDVLQGTLDALAYLEQSIELAREAAMDRLIQEVGAPIDAANELVGDDSRCWDLQRAIEAELERREARPDTAPLPFGAER